MAFLTEDSLSISIRGKSYSLQCA